MFCPQKRILTILKVLIILTALWVVVAILTNVGQHSIMRFKDNKSTKYNRKNIQQIISKLTPINPATDTNYNCYNISSSDVSTLKTHNAPGDFGMPVTLPKNLNETARREVSEGWKRHAFNEYVSDLISIRRKLPDLRDPWCKEAGRHLKILPQTSVIICFHNEAWSTLLRTVHSVLDRSPPHLIKEIILVDDYSDMPHLLQRLDKYMLTIPKVVIVRAERREGLIRARLMGYKYVTAPVITFLDSHCECTEGWLEPLLDRIARNKTTVACPFIDVINDDTFEYNYKDASIGFVGGFDWNLQFVWIQVPHSENLRHSHMWEPIASPTMPGGLFAIDKEFFERLGTYDSGLDIWGGENLELSFKTWMCGGSLEFVPCSHVGHVFRKTSPYDWRKGVDVMKNNCVRIAEVWLDDYAKYYYQRIGNDNKVSSDISDRIALRRRLGCKSFDWYIKNVYPELYVPVNLVAGGAIENPLSNMCLDSQCSPSDLGKPMKLWRCHSQNGNQYWWYTKHGEIRRDNACLDYAGKGVILLNCHDSKGNQVWLYDPVTKFIKHKASNKCLTINKDKVNVTMDLCNVAGQRQMWTMQDFNAEKFSQELKDLYNKGI